MCMYSLIAGLWAQDNGVSTINFTYAISQFKLQKQGVKDYYFDYACNIANLMFGVCYQIYKNVL